MRAQGVTLLPDGSFEDVPVVAPIEDGEGERDRDDQHEAGRERGSGALTGGAEEEEEESESGSEGSESATATESESAASTVKPTSGDALLTVSRSPGASSCHASGPTISRHQHTPSSSPSPSSNVPARSRAPPSKDNTYRWLVTDFSRQIRKAEAEAGDDLPKCVLPPADICGFSWKLTIYPKGEGKHDGGKVGIYLTIENELPKHEDGWSLKAGFSICLVNSKEGKHVMCKREDNQARSFNKKTPDWGWRDMIELDKLLAWPYTCDDCAEFEVQITNYAQDSLPVAVVLESDFGGPLLNGLDLVNMSECGRQFQMPPNSTLKELRPRVAAALNSPSSSFRFWIIATVLALAGLATLKIR